MDQKPPSHSRIDAHQVPKYRCTAAQILAAISSAITMFNVAVMYSVIVVVNGALTNTTNKDETFSITKDEASWYGGLIHLLHLVGSILAGLLQDSVGRKTCMQLCNIPQIAGWITLYYAKSSTYLYTSSILMGLGASLGEVPVATYISETASAKLRGRLFSFSKIGYGFGALFVFFFNIYLNWRILVLTCSIGPIINMCYLLIMPETPSWLLSKGRQEDALKSLRWLRGWVPARLVTEEFEKLKNYIIENKNLSKKVQYLPMSTRSSFECGKNDGQNEIWTNIKMLSRKEFLHRYKIVATIFLSSYLLSLRVVKPYLVTILKDFDINSSKILAVASVAQILGAFTMAATINRIGKKKLIFYSFNLGALCLGAIGLYSLLHSKHYFQASWLIYGIFITIFYLTGYTIGGMPWYICGEIYPQQIRGIASGVSAMTAHIMLFVLVKMYVILEATFTIPYLFNMYAVIGMLGTLYIHMQLPETENKSLEEIEKSFRKIDEQDIVSNKSLQ